MQSLQAKYDVPAPRYTSYPTVPYWEANEMPEPAWLQHVIRSFEKDGRVSIYIHLPFCEKLCTYCGCNKHITKNHAVESPYIQAVIAEWTMYLKHLPNRPILSELHLGGGTPTFFAPEQLRLLINGILDTVDIAPDHEFSFEAHPNSTSEAHLQTLYDLGFRRLSIGVQDVDEKILTIINRFQTVEEVRFVTQRAREIGYHSVNFDLVYGLPLQQMAHIEKTIDLVAELMPDRIALYSYAHVPWLKNGQRAFDESHLPDAVSKRSLYEKGKQLLEKLGYADVGMDHFALQNDALFQSAVNGSLHRNFMGYTAVYTPLCIGLGASSIGDTFDAFAQNVKTVAEYQKIVAEGQLPLMRGHFLTEDDMTTRQHILNLMCQYKTSWHYDNDKDLIIERLAEPIKDDLVRISTAGVQITTKGKAFLRNICLAFDTKYWKNQPSTQVFSKSV